MPGLAHDRTECVWHVLYALLDRFQQDGHQMVDDANADGILTEPVTVEAFRQKGSEDKTTFFYNRALAIILEPIRWLIRWCIPRGSPTMRTAKQQAGRVPSVCDTVNMCFELHQYLIWLATGSAPHMALIWGYTFTSFNEWATNEPEQVHMIRQLLRLQESTFI